MVSEPSLNGGRKLLPKVENYDRRTHERAPVTPKDPIFWYRSDHRVHGGTPLEEAEPGGSFRFLFRTLSPSAGSCTSRG